MGKRRWKGEVTMVTNSRLIPGSPKHEEYKRRQKDYYYSSVESQRKSARLRMARKRQRNQQYVVNYLEGKSCECGVSNPRHLAFDHREGEDKFANIADLVSRGAALQKLMDEIPKCDVRCHNCHMDLTIKRMGGSYHDKLKPIPWEEFCEKYEDFTQ